MKKIAIKYGLQMFAGFTLFFLLMYLMGQGQNHNLRVFNGIIHIGLIYAAIRKYQQGLEEKPTGYIGSVAMGFYASIIGVVGFTVFMLLFLVFNPALMTAIQGSTSIAEYLNPVTASLFIFVEGIVISLIGSYLVTRFMEVQNKDTLQKQINRINDAMTFKPHSKG